MGKVLVWNNQNALEMDNDDYTAIQTYLMPLTCTFKNG